MRKVLTKNFQSKKVDIIFRSSFPPEYCCRMDEQIFCQKSTRNLPGHHWDSKVTDRKLKSVPHFEIISSETSVAGRKELMASHFAILESEALVTSRRDSEAHKEVIPHNSSFVSERDSRNQARYLAISDCAHNVSKRESCGTEDESKEGYNILNGLKTFCRNKNGVKSGFGI